MFLKWVEWLSPMKYAFSAMARLEFSGLALECTSSQMRAVVKEGTADEVVRVCPYASGDEYLATLNIQPFLTVGHCMLLLSLLAVCFILLACARRARQRAARARAPPRVLVG